VVKVWDKIIWDWGERENNGHAHENSLWGAEKCQKRRLEGGFRNTGVSGRGWTRALG